MNKDAKMVAIKRFSKEDIAKVYQVPYWLMFGPKPSWFRRPVWRWRAWWWMHRWDRTVYNGHRQFENGIVWWRFTSGPLVGWGIWRRDTSAAVDHGVEPEGPRVWVGDFWGHDVWILKPESEA